MTEVKAEIDALVAQDEELRRERDRTTAQARVIGRASLFLESINLTTDDTLQRAVASMRHRVERLESELSEEFVEDRLEAALRQIGLWMTDWAKELRHEYAGSPFGLEIKHLTAVAYRSGEPIRMNRMGSSENWLGCHLITHLALQKWFVTQDRPVPSFLMFDQPSQAYFPADVPKDTPVDELDEDDREKVRRMFQFIIKVVEELSPGLQVIITDHALFDENWFREAVIEDWHGGGRRLVPESWYQQQM